MEEVGLQLDLAVLLTPDLALLGDLRTVVIRGVPLGVTQVAPVGATVCLKTLLVGDLAIKGLMYHVDVENGGADSVVVLVQDALELHVQEESAIFETCIAPMLETSALELQRMSACYLDFPPSGSAYLGDSVRRVRGKGIVGGKPVRGKTIFGPDAWVLAVETQGITVVAVDVDGSRRVSGDAAVHVRFVVDVRHNNTRVAELSVDLAPVIVVRHREAIQGELVLVLELEDNNRAAVGDLCFGDDLADLVSVEVGGIHVAWLARTECSRNTCEPSGETATGHLGVDVGARPGQDVETGLLRCLEERFQGEDAICPELAALGLDEVPVDVDGDAVVAGRLDLLKDVEPEAFHWQTKGVEFATEDHQALAVDEEAVVIPSDDLLLPPNESLAALVGSSSGGDGGQGQAHREELERLRKHHCR
jgi:hypothetical protein